MAAIRVKCSLRNQTAKHRHYPHFRTEASKPFHTTGIDFAGPSSPVQLRELFISNSQTAEKFRDKLNDFISRKTRSQRIVSDNAAVFKITAQWIKKIRK